MVKVFISYSHNDEADRNELEKHLSVLRRQKLIEPWNDRRILAGVNLGNEIDKKLTESDLILLLVSPDFLASEYCYSKEMEKALQMRREEIAWVIPIILEYCDWKNTPLKDLRACPKDGQPISEYPNPNKAFQEVVEDIREVIDKIRAERADACETAPKEVSAKGDLKLQPVFVDDVRSSNLRIKKGFTDYERDSFKKEAFEYIRKFFKNSLDELKKRNPDIEYIFEKEANKFYATVYRSGCEIASCSVINRVGNDSWRGITYSRSKQDNSVSSLLTVQDDGYSLFLAPTLMMANSNEPLSQRGAAELYWNRFIEPLQQ